MTVAIVVLALVVALLAGVSVSDRIALRNRTRDYVARTEQLATKTVECDRASFERAAFEAQVADRDRRITALEAYVTEIEESPNADLDPADVASRVRRVLLARAAEAADAAGDPVRPDAEPPVRDDAPAEVVHHPGPDDLLKPE